MIVERLLAQANLHGIHGNLEREAAAEIEWLRESLEIVLGASRNPKDIAEIERLQSRIDALHEHDGTMCPICAMENEIERLEAALAKSCEEGRNEMYDCGFNGLKAENERLRAALEQIVCENADIHCEEIARAALENNDE